MALTRNIVDMKFVRIEPGAFVMGAPDDPDSPAHRVTITRPILIGTYCVTVRQFAQFVAETAYVTSAERAGQAQGPAQVAYQWLAGIHWRNAWPDQPDTLPVVAVSWHDAVAFCQWYGQKIGRNVRLPTEAEWEFACRAGTTEAFNAAGALHELGWFGGNSGDSLFDGQTLAQRRNQDYYSIVMRDRGRPHPVGMKKPNAWGLYDMHGNVWEWCADAVAPYPQQAVVDPTGPSLPNPKWRSARGGDWYDPPSIARSFNRGNWHPTVGYTHIGFRVVQDIADAQCPRCRQLLHQSATYCRRCGLALAKSPGRRLAQRVQSLPARLRVWHNQIPVPVSSAVVMVALVLAVILGGALFSSFSAAPRPTYVIPYPAPTFPRPIYVPPVPRPHGPSMPVQIPIPEMPPPAGFDLNPRFPMTLNPRVPVFGGPRFGFPMSSVPHGYRPVKPDPLPDGCSKTELLGGTGGSPFATVKSASSPVVGLHWELGSWDNQTCLRNLIPLYEKPAPSPQNSADVHARDVHARDVHARDGYAIGGLKVINENDPVANVIAIKIVFMRLEDGKLNQSDQYESDWLGSPVHGTPERLLGTTGQLVVGVCGRHGMNLDAVGLVLSESPK